MRLGKMIRIYRAAEGVEQRDLAVEIGMSASTLCRLESGHGGLDAGNLVKLLAWLTAE